MDVGGLFVDSEAIRTPRCSAPATTRRSFAIASSSKKRPDNLVLGRLHDGHLLDAFEFGVVEAGGPCEKLLGSKPCTVFVGDFDADPIMKRVKNFLHPAAGS